MSNHFCENNSLEDYELFELANNYTRSGQFDLALIELDKIEVIYPSSRFASKSILVRAYIHFLKKDSLLPVTSSITFDSRFFIASVSPCSIDEISLIFAIFN